MAIFNSYVCLPEGNHIHHRLLKVDVSPWLRGRLSHVTRDAVVRDETCGNAKVVAIIFQSFPANVSKVSAGWTMHLALIQHLMGQLPRRGRASRRSWKKERRQRRKKGRKERTRKRWRHMKNTIETKRNREKQKKERKKTKERNKERKKRKREIK